MHKNIFCALCVFLFSQAVLLGVENEYDDDLRADGEELVFSFELEQSRKVSVCVSAVHDYIVCRIGTKDNIELVFPESSDNSWDKFTYEYYLRGGGAENAGLDLNYLFFEKDGLHYTVYHEYSAESGDMYVGIRIKNIATGKRDEFECVKEDSIKGSLLRFRDEPRLLN